jgi:hypothetical protein
MLLQGADVRAGGGMTEAGDDVAYRGRVGDQGLNGRRLTADGTFHDRTACAVEIPIRYPSSV